MMEKKIINSKNAPAPIGPYSHATSIGNLLFVSGQVPMNAATGEVIKTSVKDETEMVMQNLKAILTEAGVGFENVMKATIFLMDMNMFADVNEVYATYFPNNPPARECVQVAGLPRGVNVEISVIAHL